MIFMELVVCYVCRKKKKNLVEIAYFSRLQKNKHMKGERADRIMEINLCIFTKLQ